MSDNSREEFKAQVKRFAGCAREWKETKARLGKGWSFPALRLVREHDPVLAGLIQDVETGMEKLYLHVLTKIEDQ